MRIDSVIANAGRLKILTALAAEDRLDFVDLRQRSNLTDGNLATHARKLESAGLLSIEKHFRAGKPVTTMMLTHEGKLALQSHVENVMSALRPDHAEASVAATAATASVSDDDWVD